MSGLDPAEVGTCALCGQEMVLTPTMCWHPWTVEKACPPTTEIDRAAGQRSGQPGRQHFRRHLPFTEAGATRCGGDGVEGCGEPWPCTSARTIPDLGLAVPLTRFPS